MTDPLDLDALEARVRKCVVQCHGDREECPAAATHRCTAGDCNVTFCARHAEEHAAEKWHHVVPGEDNAVAEALAAIGEARRAREALRDLAETVHREHLARMAWLATLPDGATPRPSSLVLDAEEATRAAVRRVM